MKKFFSLLLALALLPIGVVSAATDTTATHAHQWASGYTHSPASDEPRDVGSFNYGLMFLIQSYVLEVGYGFGKEPLQRYAELNLDIVGADDSVRSSTLAERFGMIGDILEDLRLNEVRYVADLSLIFAGDDLDYQDKYTVLLYTQSDDDSVSYFIEYNIMSHEYKMYTVNND